MKFAVVRNRTRKQESVVEPVFEEAGIKLDRFFLDNGDTFPLTDEYNGYIVFGGKGSAKDFDARVVAQIRERIEGGTAYLGFCLGAQLGALALGADIVEMEEGIFGIYHFQKVPDTGDLKIPYSMHLTKKGKEHPALRGLSTAVPVGRLHKEKIIPHNGLEVLAEGVHPITGDTIVEAVAYKRFLAFQCHIEFTPEGLAEMAQHSESVLHPLRNTIADDYRRSHMPHKVGETVTKQYIKHILSQ